MKLHVCDICRKEGKLTEATRKVTFSKGSAKLAVDYCPAHKDWYKAHTFDSAMDFICDVANRAPLTVVK